MKYVSLIIGIALMVMGSFFAVKYADYKMADVPFGAVIGVFFFIIYSFFYGTKDK